jgi:NADH-quinone oxidoreductase subunit A
LNRDFVTVLVFLAIGGGFVFASLIAGLLIRPKVKNAMKETIYECGEKVDSTAWFNFNPRFYVIALIFIVFDVALAILFPVLSVISGAVSSPAWLGMAAATILFLFVLSLGLAYVKEKGDLDWIKK